MSVANIDWGDLKPIETGGIDWGDLQPIEPEKSIGLPAIGLGKKVAPKSQVADMQRTLGRTGKVVGSTLGGMAGDVAAIPSQIAEAFGADPRVMKAAQLSTPLGQLPTSEGLTKEVEKIAPSTKPRTPEEKDWEDNLALITGLATPLPGGKAKALNPKMKDALYVAAKELGLSEKDVAPLFANKHVPGLLGALTKKAEEAKAALGRTQNALGGVYDTLKELPVSKTFLPDAVESELIGKLRDFRQNLMKTIAHSPEEKNMIGFVDEAIEKLINAGATPEELINFFQGINKKINWKSIEGGRKRLAELKGYIKDAIHAVDPKLAKDFNTVNKLWEKSEKVMKAIGTKRIHDFVNYSAGAASLYALVTGDFDSLQKIGIGVLAKKGLSKLATKMLTDPKWQTFHTRILNAMKNQSPKMAQSILASLKPFAKDELTEEEYEELFSDLK